MKDLNTPKKLGYHFPAEWEAHRATWLSYPHDDSYSWPGTLPRIFPYYNEFIRVLSENEKVCINVRNEDLKKKVMEDLKSIGTDLSQIEMYIHPTNDAWCRDHGPAFVINPKEKSHKAVVNWKYNAWGGKYPFELDDQIPELIAKALHLPVFYPGIIMEGGAVEFNGKGTLLTSTSCLLHENRNPQLSQNQLEEYLMEYYGVDQILWLNEGIDGDDTNGHIDDICRFFREDAALIMVEPHSSDTNYQPLLNNMKELKKMRLLNGKQIEIAEVPMPKPVFYEGQRLPASYANFYIASHSVIVPVYRCKEDDQAMAVLEECFPEKKIVGIDSTEIIWGLGSWHCLSQQEPA
ncbi:MAG: agmatine deiminase family protein [Bacteroidota bacterium]|nr:agmatine deiminase family protein [Bacteroidota bacterium]